MKNGKEINSYLRNLRAATIEDKDKIEKYLLTLGFETKIKILGLSIPSITFKEFKAWFHKDLPTPNDIVSLTEENVIGIVKEIKHKSIVLGVHIKDDELYIEDKSFPFCSFTYATDEEVMILQHTLSSKQLRWSQFFRKVFANYIFGNNDYVRITRLGKVLGFGVFKEINENEEIVMYVVKMNNEPLKLSGYEIVGPEKDYQLETISVKERQMFTNQLMKCNKSWNGFQSRIEPVVARAKEGGIYYYINDYFEIIGTKDLNKPKDLKRWKKCNYFYSKDEAEEMLQFIQDKRSRQMINN